MTKPKTNCRCVLPAWGTGAILILNSGGCKAETFTSNGQTATQFGVHEVRLVGVEQDGPDGNPFNICCNVSSLHRH